MKAFARLIRSLGSSTGSNEKRELLTAYFKEAAGADAVWVIALSSGRRPRRLVPSTRLQEWCAEWTGIPGWLFAECYHTVGDLAETIALLLPEGTPTENIPSLRDYMHTFLQLQQASEEEKKAFVTGNWQQLDADERFVFNKLITGGFRIGVSQQLLVQALARLVELNPSTIAHRISGKWDPAQTSLQELLSADAIHNDRSKPYPFYLSYALDDKPEALEEPAQWQAEWKWDGIRGQIIRRGGTLFVWSRGEELLTEKFPEYLHLQQSLPDGTVLDGEIISMHREVATLQPLPFSALQIRIGRKQVSRRQLQEAPAAFIAYDLLEYAGADIRTRPLAERRQLLEQVVQAVQDPVLRLSPLVPFAHWDELGELRLQARNNGSEGLMLKRRSSSYQAGRKRGDWWKWKLDPLMIDCVLVYAQKGHGRRSNLYTDYTFAVRDGDRLVTFTKAYSGLTDAEFAEVDAFVKKHALEKFGPVRTVKPELVFEIAFEGIAASSRHKSGVALRFPRMNRWRKDKTVADINTLDDLKTLLQQYGS